MLGLIKSIGNKAISSLPPIFSTSKIKITIPYDQRLQQKLQQISTQILKAQLGQQFKVYQQLQSVQGADFNRSLRKIYQSQQCTTQSINGIIRFYTFLLTNCRNELVVCKLVSQPLVIQLTKIVLQLKQQQQKQLGQQSKQQQRQQLMMMMRKCQQQQNRQQQIQLSYEQIVANTISVQINSNNNTNNNISSLHYVHDIDWQQVNAYKVALIRAYINCINVQTINYMIVQNQLPIFVNCINGYKHYLTEGVEGTCVSNCILMILTKVNHNQEVCGIVFGMDKEMENRMGNTQNKVMSRMDDNIVVKQRLSKSISSEKSIKLHEFIGEIIITISKQVQSILLDVDKIHINTNNDNNKTNRTNTSNIDHKQLLTYPMKLQPNQQFIESNILFCIDLINSISNYNYTAKIKQSIGSVIQKQLINRIITFVQQKQHHLYYQSVNNDNKNNYNYSQSPFNILILKLIKYVLNLSIVCQKQQVLIKFLNKHCVGILQNIVEMNDKLFGQQEQKQNQQQQQNHNTKSSTGNNDYTKHILTYTCTYSLILIKQTLSTQSKLSSRRKQQQTNTQLNELKQSILEKLFTIMQQITKYQLLKQGVCYKAIRNLLLTVFYLTIKEDKCMITGGSSSSPRKSKGSLSPLMMKKGVINNKRSSPEKQVVQQQQTLIISTQNNQLPQLSSQQQQSQTPIKLTNPSQQQPPITTSPLMLTFTYTILSLHKQLTLHFKKILAQNKNWQFIVNNYETLMRQIPNTILHVQQSDKYCHYHNNNNYHQQDKIRDHILKYQAIRNYRYMIIHETTLQQRLIRLENIYHRHFLSPGWGYTPGEVISFGSGKEYKIVCMGLLHNNNMMKLPIEILHDSQCLLITHKLSQCQLQVIANIRYKKIASFTIQSKCMIRMKLIGIQQLILQFGGVKILNTFKQYLSESRNKTREKQLKFINYYMNMYLQDSQRLIQGIYQREIFDVAVIDDDDNKQGEKVIDKQQQQMKFQQTNLNTETKEQQQQENRQKIQID